ncbi:MAG: hypothetical protein NTV82_02095 [Candidatus Aminicenantes bacterium]|nr:hypothetical protein [Candidatus Aminicenantes bacterium]
MSPSQNCILCNHEAVGILRQPSSDTYQIECKVCGKYKSTDLHDPGFRQLSEAERTMLSAYTRELYEYNEPIPELHVLDDQNQIKNIIERYKKKSVVEKLDNLILYVGKKSHYFGEALSIHGEDDYPITFSINKNEFDKIKEQAFKSKFFLEPSPHGNVQLDWLGSQRIEEIKKAGHPTKKCFVAMSCADELRAIYDNGIRLAVLGTGYDPVFIEREETNEKICDRIVAEIRSCKFLVADVTGERQNVYYEAGFAQGLGRDVIWTCKQGETLHFDTRQYKHIIWQSPEDLKKQLINRIRATILIIFMRLKD